MVFTVPAVHSDIDPAAMQRVSPEKGLASELPSPTSQPMRLQTQIFVFVVVGGGGGIWYSFGVFSCSFFFSLPTSLDSGVVILAGERET